MQLAADRSEPTDYWAQRWLELENRPRMVLARSRRVLWQSDAAAQLLTDAGPFTRDGDQLAGADEASHSALVGCLDAAKPGRPVHAVVEDGGARHYLLEARALAEGPDAPIGVTLRKQDEPTLPDLLPVFGLTSSERQVTAMLLKGQNPNEIAYALSISVETVRTHIKRVHAKLKVHTKEQLFAKLYMFVV